MHEFNNFEGTIFVSARNFAEYVRMFSLSKDDFQKKILDCAAGAASFTSEFNNMGGQVKALDPLYSENMGTIEARVMAGVARASGNVHEKPDHYNWNYLPDPETHYATRLQAAQTFLEDIRSKPESYIPGALPSLPFLDQEFDIILCSHLLFTYAGVLGTDFHIAAILEMLRVCTTEIRVFPIVGFYSNADTLLLEVLNLLATMPTNAEIVPVDYHFFKGSGNMLRITRLK